MPAANAHAATLADHAAHYAQLRWCLCSIPPGTKGPRDDNWNQPAAVLDTADKAIAAAINRPSHGFGLVHSASGTCAFDIDHLEYARLALAELGVDLDALIAGAPQIIGREGRGKAIFALPEGLPARTHKLTWPKSTPTGKPTTVFELRAGPVQDVLPPTVHPDTQRPYTWAAGEPPATRDDIPVLPDALVTIWREWPTFKVQMEAACPWAVKAPPPKPRVRKIAGGHQNIIGQFNEAHDVTAMLKAHGYVPRGKRWLAPTSSSGLAGVVVFEDGTHCYSHHASDPLNDGHAHDAFSLFCLLEHGGDMGAAVSAAASVLGIDSKPPQAIPMVDMSALMQRMRKPRPDVDTMPAADLLTIPGVLGVFVDYVNRTAPKPQPQFAVQAALALAGVAMGRHWCTDDDNYPANYYVNVGKSASGKEHPRTAIVRALEAAGLTKLLGPGGYTSDGAVFSQLHTKPTHLAIIDELGDLLGNAKAQGNFHKRQAISVLVQSWGLLHGTLRPQAYSSMSLTAKQREEMEDRIVHRPSLSLLAMTTPKTFYGALTEESIEGGFLNRLIIAQSDLPPRVRGRFERLDPPAAVVEWIKAVFCPKGAGNLSGFDVGPDAAPSPRVLEFSPEARALLAQYEAECIDEIRALDGEGLAEMHGRSCEKAQRLSLKVAASIDPASTIVPAQAARWAINYIRHYTAQTLSAIREHMHGSQFAQWRQSVLETVRKGGAKGRTEFEIARACRPFAGLEPRLRRSVLDSLKADQLAEFVDMGKGPGGRGKSRQAWVAINTDTSEGHADAE